MAKLEKKRNYLVESMELYNLNEKAYASYSSLSMIKIKEGIGKNRTEAHVDLRYPGRFVCFLTMSFLLDDG